MKSIIQTIVILYTIVHLTNGENDPTAALECIDTVNTCVSNHAKELVENGGDAKLTDDEAGNVMSNCWTTVGCKQHLKLTCQILRASGGLDHPQMVYVCKKLGIKAYNPREH